MFQEESCQVRGAHSSKDCEILKRQSQHYADSSWLFLRNKKVDTSAYHFATLLKQTQRCLKLKALDSSYRSASGQGVLLLFYVKYSTHKNKKSQSVSGSNQFEKMEKKIVFQLKEILCFILVNNKFKQQFVSTLHLIRSGINNFLSTIFQPDILQTCRLYCPLDLLNVLQKFIQRHL